MIHDGTSRLNSGGGAGTSIFSASFMVCALLSLAGCGTPVGPSGFSASAASQPQAASAESSYGIRVEGLRLSAAGAVLDLRYRVLDAQKAAPILDGKSQPYLVDALRGARLGVPNTPVLGRIRQTARNKKIMTDRTYFIMFGNPGKALQSGDRVTLLIGQVKITELTVQ